MSSKQAELQKMAALAYLDTTADDTNLLFNDVTSIMNYVEQLRKIDTNHIQPLTHPLDIHQRLRPDAITEKNHSTELDAIAPLFVDGLFLVPKVIEAGK